MKACLLFSSRWRYSTVFFVFFKKFLLPACLWLVILESWHFQSSTASVRGVVWCLLVPACVSRVVRALLLLLSLASPSGAPKWQVLPPHPRSESQAPPLLGEEKGEGELGSCALCHIQGCGVRWQRCCGW